MTGGIGFSKLGQDSFKKNRELLTPRKKMKENPYAGTGPKRMRRFLVAFDELRRWKNAKDNRERRLRTAIFVSLAILGLLLVAAVVIYNNVAG